MMDDDALRYANVTYRGDVTAADHAQPGELLGRNVLGVPWEVIDAEYDAGTDRTTVHLQLPTPESLKAGLERAQAAAAVQMESIGRLAHAGIIRV